RKHRVERDRLPALSAQLNDRLASLDNHQHRLQELNATVEEHAAEWRAAAQALSKARQQAAKALSARVESRLAELGMDTARLDLVDEPNAQTVPGSPGMERIAIEFSANPGQPLQPLSRVASGGELSRVALALMIADDRPQGAKTRIFDEVDAGVGGETAHAVGRFLRQAAAVGQAMCVTLLAQVAACADHQLRVHKDKGSDSTLV